MGKQCLYADKHLRIRSAALSSALCDSPSSLYLNLPSYPAHFSCRPSSHPPLSHHNASPFLKPSPPLPCLSSLVLSTPLLSPIFLPPYPSSPPPPYLPTPLLFLRYLLPASLSTSPSFSLLDLMFLWCHASFPFTQSPSFVTFRSFWLF